MIPPPMPLFLPLLSCSAHQCMHELPVSGQQGPRHRRTALYGCVVLIALLCLVLNDQRSGAKASSLIQSRTAAAIRPRAPSGKDGGHRSRKEIVVKAILSVVFVLLGGIFSGLSLGLMGLDSMNLQVLAASGPPADRQDAQRVLSLLSHGRHFVLVCLLLSNVIVNETLPVFLDSLTGGGGWIAVVISSASIVIFGEVVPQALCSQHGLRIGARCVGFVRLLMYLEAPVCWPAAKLLDLLLGSHTTHFYRREELRTLLDLHADHGSAARSQSNDVGLSAVESEMLGNVLHLEAVAIHECCSPVDKVYAVTDGMRLCDIKLPHLLATGQLFLPIRQSPSFAESERTVAGTLLGYVTTLELVTALSNPNELVRTIPRRPFIQVSSSTPANECIAYLKREDPTAVFALVDVSGAAGAHPVGFATFADLSRLITMSLPATIRERPASLGATARISLSRPPRPSSSLGLQNFVRGELLQLT
ncbi:hypothetical protein BMF94_0878 [Rhodotorula taiwanensis]|uniref:CNNM transmembrane domain-containing protein n=1 Tax=Rhodotorula taiwanensis TaxID=741276 RepID=A0A2S5BHC0_9BASI|nr:hypothetical protein BMF94_0878 [Rhodotorula taiwanensis]